MINYPTQEKLQKENLTIDVNNNIVQLVIIYKDSYIKKEKERLEFKEKIFYKSEAAKINILKKLFYIQQLKNLLNNM